ncbi:FtsK/SpoIIIE domain-containing protein [Arthrobacter sp. 2MCAF14]|uniref:FtsK/SpoIIIE domain-containing protein n=1 Tax=Arthrobacter sp. 2MCAF14 TaxID=3232982 RepID=UPI003F914FC4
MASLTSRELRFELPDGTSELVTVSWKAGATIAALVVRIAEYLRLSPDSVHLLIWGGRVRLDPDSLVSECQLVRHQELRVLDSASALDMPTLPTARDSGALVRVRHLSGPQLGVSWPISHERPLLLRRDGDYLLPVRNVDEAEIQLSLVSEVETAEPLVEIFDPHDVVSRDGADVRVALPPDTELEIAFTGGAPLRVRLVSDSKSRLSESPDGRAVYVPGIGELRALKLPQVQNIRLQKRPVPQLPEDRPWLRVLRAVPLLAMALVMLFVLQSWWSLLGFIAIGVVTFVSPKVEKAYAIQKAKKEQTKWSEAADVTAGQLGAIVDTERATLIGVTPPIHELVGQARQRTGCLWELRQGDSWFLQVPIGLGTWQSKSTIVEDAELTDAKGQEWVSFFRQQRYRPSVPHLLSLADHHLGVAGPRSFTLKVVNQMLARIAVTHDPASLSMVVITRGVNLDDWRWLTSTPHAASGSSWYAGPALMVDPEHAESFQAEILSVAMQQRDVSEHLVIVIDDLSKVNKALLDKVVAESTDRHTGRMVHLIILAPSDAALPRLVDVIATPEPDGQAWLVTHLDSDVYPLKIGLLPIEEGDLGQLAESLSGITSEAYVGTGRAIPSDIMLGQLVSDELGAPWQQDAAASLVARLGIFEGGEFELDLKSHGPHLLIGGTTGSGKSELLRTLTLSLAIRYSPSECQLMLLDYKGGATFSDLAVLPHVVGSVSNLEAADVTRVVDFLDGELLSRQAALRDFGGDYEKYRQKSNAKKNGLARLVVIIDEFAAFLDEGNPGRGRAILGIAARGRSLGVHLVIATQSPQQVVDRQVRANVNARVSLRTLDVNGSEAVIGSPEAAMIPRDQKGRAIVRLDSDELIHFQSARTDKAWLDTPASSTDVSLRGQRATPTKPADETDDDAAYLIAQLKLEAQRQAEATGKPVMPEGTELFLPRLEVQDPEVFHPGEANGGQVMIGRVDEPRMRRQPELLWKAPDTGLLLSVPVGWAVAPLVNGIVEQHADGLFLLHYCFSREPVGGLLLGDSERSITGASAADLVQLAQQIEVLPPAHAPQAMIVIERLDFVFEAMTDIDRTAVARALSYAGSKGVLTITTVEDRQRPPSRLSASLQWFKFHGPQHTFMDMTEREVRFVSSDAQKNSAISTKLALGRMPTLDGTLATDLLTGVPMDLVAEHLWLGTGPRGQQRNQLVLQIAKLHYKRTKNPAKILTWADWDLPEYLASLHDHFAKQPPATLAEMVLTSFTEGDSNELVLLTELERIDRNTKPELPSKFSWRQGEFRTADLLSALSRRTVTSCTFRTAFERPNYNQNAHEAIGLGNVIVVCPVDQDRIPTGSGAGTIHGRFLCAAPGRVYRENDGIMVVDGERHEVAFQWDKDVIELAKALSDRRIFL